MSIPNTNFSSSNYSNNDLNNIFPVTEYHYSHVTGNNSSASGTITLNNNFGTNYAVFTSIYYGYSGSDGTYDSTNTSGALSPVVINTIKSSSFKWVFSKTTGDNVNIYIVFMVVYNNALDYPKSYS